MAQSLGGAGTSMEDCIMLALSTFRKSEKAVDLAIEKARASKKLLVVFVTDVNLARYLVGAEHGLIADMKDSCEADLLKKHEKEGQELVATISEKAKKEGIEVKTLVKVGRFAIVCVDIARREKPSVIVTTRSQRPEWVKKFFGAPVDELIDKAECTVTVA